MKISVCMGIYNGEKYIEGQLFSLLHQTRRPDEVILCDDGSKDATVEKVQHFIKENALQDSWNLYQNEQNKGYPGNFYYAMGLCTGDIVFLADQDDIWHRTKIEKMLKVFEQQSNAKCVCCKFGLIDGEGHDIHSIMAPAQTRGTGELRNVTISDVFYKCEWPGMVMAYRNEWYRNWSTGSSTPTGQNQQELTRTQQISVRELTIPHDFLICARAAEEEAFLQMDEELAYHRRHDNNAGGEEHRLKKLLNKQRKLKEIEDYLRILDAFAQEKVLRTQHAQDALRRKRCSMHGRYEALQSGKISEVIKNACGHRNEVRPVTVICDVLIVRQ